MEFANNSGAKIYWTEQGAGEPLLLIMGLGGSHKEWWRIVPKLSEKYRVITFDNRGAGETLATDEPFTMELMASDAKAVLNAANVESAHILGMSMGGMIAQEFALNYPEMTRSLILAVTNCGGREAILAKPEVLFTLQGRGIATPEDAFWAMVPFIYDAGTPRETIAEDLAIREGKFTTPENFMRQLQAIMTWQGTHSSAFKYQSANTRHRRQKRSTDSVRKFENYRRSNSKLKTRRTRKFKPYFHNRSNRKIVESDFRVFER